MSNVTMVYNGHELSEYLDIHDIQRDIGNQRTITSDDAPLIGVNIQQVKIGAKTITVNFSIFTKDRNKLKHLLAGIFNVDGPKKLTFSDEPDKYYLAIAEGDISMHEDSNYRSVGSVRFLIPDGVAHATAYKTFDKVVDKGDHMELEITNNGTVPAYPIFTINHTAENGYIGLMNESGALELGNRNELDTQTVRKSEILFDYTSNSRIRQGYAAGRKNVGISNVKYQKLKGDLAIEENWGRPHLYLRQRGDTTGEAGSSITWDIPNDSQGGVGALNEYFWWRQIFWLGSAMQVGYLKIMLSDTDGNFLYGVETIKQRNGLDADFNFLATDGKGGYKVIRHWGFVGTHRSDQNPFNEPQGWSDIIRRDDMVDVYWRGGRNQFRIPEMKGKRSAKLHVLFGTFDNRPMVSHMYLDGLVYRKDFINVFEDIPNRYQEGTKLEVNCEKDLILINDLPKLNELVHGSSWLACPPGKSTVKIYTSSWCRKKPTIKAEIEEREL